MNQLKRAEARGKRLGLLAAARIAEGHARLNGGGVRARKGSLEAMRKAGKNTRSGETGDAFKSHARMFGYFLDKMLTAQAIAAEIREEAQKVTQ